MSYTKDPDARLDYRWDWASDASPWLASGEQITTATVLVPAGLTLDSQTHDTTTVTAWLTGGTAGDVYPVTCRITTNQGRTDDRTLTIRCKER